MNNLETVKRNGSIRALSQHIDEKLWSVRTLIESAAKNCHASLPSDIGNAKACMDEALAAWKERDAMQKQPQSRSGEQK